MSTQVPMILADGQTTPVNRTFAPRGANGKLAVWKDVSSGSVSAYPVLTLNTAESTGSNGSRTVKLRITMPVMEVAAGPTDSGYQAAPKVAFNCFAKVEYTLPNRSSLQNVKDIHAFVKAALAHTMLTETVVLNDPPY